MVSGVWVVQRSGPVPAGKRVEEMVVIEGGGTVGRRSCAVAVDRVLQPVPRRVRDVPDGRDEPSGGDSGRWVHLVHPRAARSWKPNR